MATIKIFSAGGIKELNCFDTADDVEYLSPETGFPVDPFDDVSNLEPE